MKRGGEMNNSLGRAIEDAVGELDTTEPYFERLRGRGGRKGWRFHAGECGLFAKALRKALGGGEYYCSYQGFVWAEDGEPAHCALEYKGRLYDADGLISHGAGKNLKEDIEILKEKAFDEAYPEEEENHEVNKVGEWGMKRILGDDGGDKKTDEMAKIIRKHIRKYIK
jgi:hypothetical protein